MVKEVIWTRELACGHSRDTHLAFFMRKYNKPKVGETCHCRECIEEVRIITVSEVERSKNEEYYKWAEDFRDKCSSKTSKQHSKIQNESNIHSKKQSDNNQQKKDDEALHVSHLGTRSTEEGDNTMEYKTNVVDNHADNPQDDPGQTSGVAKGDTGDGTFPADLKYNEEWDSHYNEEKDIWLEKPCQYEDCEFCSNRPTKPSECND